MGSTKTIELSINSTEIARQIADPVAEFIDCAIREFFESDGLSDDILGDNDFWNSIIEDLISQLKA